MENKCPFCGAAKSSRVEWATETTYDYACGTEGVPGGYVRSKNCYEAELAAMTIQVQELREWSAGHENEIIFHHIEISRTAYHKGLHRGLEERAKEIGGLKALVREMAFADYTQFTEILNRPAVRAIMEEE